MQIDRGHMLHGTDARESIGFTAHQGNNACLLLEQPGANGGRFFFAARNALYAAASAACQLCLRDAWELLVEAPELQTARNRWAG